MGLWWVVDDGGCCVCGSGFVLSFFLLSFSFLPISCGYHSDDGESDWLL